MHLGDRHLRLNCAEHLAADPETAKQPLSFKVGKSNAENRICGR